MSSSTMEADMDTKPYFSTHPTQPSEIQQYFRDATIFLTGATGFIGKLLIEKLLRSCPDVKRIYVLVRPKKGKDVKTRVQELVDGVIFNTLKKNNPEVFDKIFAVSGDCSLPDLGMSDDFKKTMSSEVNCIIHCAATVRFDEPLPSAVNINVRGTRDLITLAKKMEKLEALVYVSTAYCNCPRSTVKEELYDTPISAEKLITISQSLNEATLKKITPTILGEWPNTYTFTKAVAEDVVKSVAEELPVAVVRPSIVIGTVREPLEGWIDNLYGSTGVVIGAYTGLMRTLHCDPNTLADMVPADFVVNETLAATWDVGRKVREKKMKKGNGYKQTQEEVNEAPKVFNCVSSVDNPITWKKYMSILEVYGMEMPSMFQIWYYWFTLNPNRFVHLLFVFFFHSLPAYAADVILFCIGKKPRMVTIYKKVGKFSDVISYFCTRQWQFTNSNSRKLWEEMNDQDKQLFTFDMKEFGWEKFLLSAMKGGRIYLLNDPMDTVTDALRRLYYFRIAHYVVVGAVCLGLLKVTSIVLRSIVLSF
ncbi:fatty acyl-CoA reductase wat isoform X2 [Agrilus planipennis]|nr:fatty acyl-CoA reductase wat isoform X2 [Agrilus planipennis]XP_025837495.1 fatty acyl-CoA reductase wat isoform X2 [Agrilus planipennis]